MDFYPFKPEQRPGAIKRTLKKALFCGGIALYAALNLGVDLNKGDLTHFKSAGTSTLVEDNELIIVNENTAGRLTFDDNVGLMLHHNADLGTFQEIRKDYASQFTHRIPGAVGTFAMADLFTSPTDGGFGITTVSRVPVKYDYMHQLEGDLRFQDLIDAVKTFDVSKMKAAYQERRAALVGIYEAVISGQKVPVRLMNIHTAGYGEAARLQQAAISEIVRQEFTNDGELRIITGDFNELPEEVRRILGRDYIVAEIGRTSVNRDEQIDHFAYRPFVVINKQKFRVEVKIDVVKEVHSDHYPYIAHVTLKPAALFEEEALLIGSVINEVVIR